ncbi:hypothetical protein Tco_1272298 [Tanacetum coccineum]
MNPNSNEYKNASEDDGETDLWFMMKAIEMHEMMEQEGQSSKTRQPIYYEYDDAEAHLIRDYFGEHPKYPEHKLRRRYRMSRNLFLEIVEAQMAIKDNIGKVVIICERSRVRASPWGFSFRSEKRSEALNLNLIRTSESDAQMSESE